MEKIEWFIGDYHFLSNFYPSPFELDGTHYSTVEHAYQAAKSISPYQRDYILAAKSPGEAKKRGRKIARTEDWEGIKYGRMYKFVFAKFFQNPALRKELLATYPYELIEGNTWGDTYWGVCRGEGENKLGQILMYIRLDLK